LSSKIVLMQKEGSICKLTLNRPKIMNAFNGAMGTGLSNAFEKIATDRDVRVVIFQGAGKYRIHTINLFVKIFSFPLSPASDSMRSAKV